MDIHVIWFALLTVLLGGYAVLDGFDLGVGILHPLAETDRERRLFLNAIGPIWDGNEVWLVTFGGALFAAFPMAYATVFSGFYLAFILLLFALIFRAVSIEFRSKHQSPRWRRTWDYGFFVSSLLASFLFGVAVGNAIIGIPLDERYNYHGGLFALLSPFPLLVGLAVVVTFAMHGALYLHLKIPDDGLRLRIKNWMWHAWGLFLVLYLLGTAYTLVNVPRAAENVRAFPWAAVIVVISVLAIANIPRALYAGRSFEAFLSSTIAIFSLVMLFSLLLWPNMVTNSANPADSLTIYRAASSEATLWLMFKIALIGMPFVLLYTGAVYWTFRGRVEITETSY
jgi:cytochrome d ubiquinol oxidase subunit II